MTDADDLISLAQKVRLRRRRMKFVNRVGVIMSGFYLIGITLLLLAWVYV